jgi:type 1 glutamine amidotransferase
MAVKRSIIGPLVAGMSVAAAALVASAVGFAQAPAPAGQAPAAPQVQQAPGQPAQPGRGGRAGGRGAGRQGGARGPQNQVASVEDLVQMMAALPERAPATPAQPRRVLVLARAGGFVHSSIPLATRTIEALGQKTGAWTTVISYDPADINTANLAQYDAIFLASTTGAFLDDATDAAATAARRAAFMEFVRGGKGVAGIHAATDSYHEGGKPTWPEFNTMIGGSFKDHWNNPTLITVKIDDPDNPINAAFTRVNPQTGARTAQSFQLTDEVYTFAQDSWSRARVRTLTSIDYARMPDNIKAQEPAATKRTDGDYGLSYIRKEGNGRVFVQVLGHDHSIYKMRPMLEHILAGMQYALGDLKVDDAPVPLKQ